MGGRKDSLFEKLMKKTGRYKDYFKEELGSDGMVTKDVYRKQEEQQEK